MARANKGTHRLDADFTEDTVGFALESFLTLLSFPYFNFSIEPFSRSRERVLGADARLNSKIKGFKPFYMQFKRPSAYPDYSTSKIISDRKKLHLTVGPHSLYFGLREKQPTHVDFQHNILYRLRNHLMNRGIGDAAYVCPLFLDRAAYRFHSHMAGISRWSLFCHRMPWDIENISINSSTGTLKLSSIPVLKEHISIPPHDKVNSAKHSYSFTERGKELCFHSPLALTNETNDLSKFLEGIIGNIGNDRGLITVETASQELFEIFGSYQDDASLLTDDILSNQNGISAWLDWGSYLKDEYDIEQFALIHWKD